MCQKFSGLHVNPSPERHCGFPKHQTRGSCVARWEVEGKGITLKKWTVMSCVRAPPREHKFL